MRTLHTYAEHMLKKAFHQSQALTVDFNSRKFLKEIKKLCDSNAIVSLSFFLLLKNCI